jgi:hypothetical protein
MKVKDALKIAEAVVNKNKEVIRKSRISVREGGLHDELLPIHKDSVPVGASDANSLKVKKFQEMSDDLLLLSKSTEIPIVKLDFYNNRFKPFLDESELKKAMTTTSQADWVPTDFSTDFIDKVQLELKVANLFPEIILPRSPMDFSRKSSYSTAYKKTEGSNGVESAVGDGKMTFTCTTICDYVSLTYELEEDAAFAQMPMIKQDAINAIARAWDNCIINGDTTSPHMDSDVTLAYDQRKCWKGLRKHAIENSYWTDLSGGFNMDNVMGLMKNMGIYGADLERNRWIVGVKGQVSMLNIKDNQNNRVFVENPIAGPQSLNIGNGQIGFFGGTRTILSEFVRENLNASAVYDGSVITNGSILRVRTDGFARGVVRRILVETDKNIVNQTKQLVVSTRGDFQPRHDITSERIVELGYKYTA